MFRFCPNCQAKLRPIGYKTHGMLRHYFECKCGWTNKPENTEASGFMNRTAKQ